MVIIYGTRTVFKREGPVGTSVCPNCRHNVMHTLCRQLNQATLFYIRVFFKHLFVTCVLHIKPRLVSRCFIIS